MKFMIHCFKCFTTYRLTMYPQLANGFLIGWIFSCDECIKDGACINTEITKVEERNNG